MQSAMGRERKIKRSETERAKVMKNQQRYQENERQKTAFIFSDLFSTIFGNSWVERINLGNVYRLPVWPVNETLLSVKRKKAS